jgi:hypothetical protein
MSRHGAASRGRFRRSTGACRVDARPALTTPHEVTINTMGGGAIRHVGSSAADILLI